MPDGEGKRRFLIEIVGDTDQAVEAIGRVADRLRGLQENAQAVAKTTTAQFGGIGTSAGRMADDVEVSAASFFQSAAVVAGAAFAMKRGLDATLLAAADLELQIDRVNDVIDRTGASTQAMAVEFLEAGRNAGDLIGAASEFAKVGAKGQEQIRGLADTAFRFGVVADMSATDAAAAISRFALALGTAPDKLQNLASAVIFLSEKTGVSAQQMQFFVSVLGASARQAGFSEAGVLGLAARLGQLGIVGKRAGPALLNLFNILAERPGRIASVLGMTTEQLQAMKPEEVFIRLLESVKAAGKDAPRILEQLGIKGNFAQAAFLNLANQTDALKDSIKLAGEGFANTNKLQEEFEERTGTLRAQIKLLGDQIEALFTRIGVVMVPIVTVLVKAFRALISVVSAIPTPILGAIGVLFGIVAAAVLLANALFLAGKGALLLWRNTVQLVGALLKSVLWIKTETVALTKNAAAWWADAKARAAASKETSALTGTMAQLGVTAAGAGVVALVIAGIASAILFFTTVLPKAIEMIDKGTVATKLLGAALLLLFLPILPLVPLLVAGFKLLEGIVKGFLEVVEPVVKSLFELFGIQEENLGIMDALKKAMEGLVSVGRVLGKVLGVVAIAVALIAAPIIALVWLVKKLIAVWDTVVGVLKIVAAPIFALVWLVQKLVEAWDSIVKVLKIVATVWLLLNPPLLLLVVGIKLLIAAFEWLLDNAIEPVWSAIKFLLTPAIWVVTKAVDLLAWEIGLLVGWVKFLGEIIGTVVVAAVEAVIWVFNLWVDWMKILGAILAVVWASAVWGLRLIVGAVKQVIKFVEWLSDALFGSGLHAAIKAVTKAFDVFFSIVTAPMRVLQSIVEAIRDVLLAVVGAAAAAGRAIAAGFSAAAGSTARLEKNIKTLGDESASTMDRVVAGTKAVVETVGGPVGGFVVGAVESLFGGASAEGRTVIAGGTTAPGTTAPAEMARPDRAAVERPAAMAAFAPPRIVIVSQLVLDGRVVAESVQEHQALELERFFNAPVSAMRGISG